MAIHAPCYASCRYEGHITDDDRICDKPGIPNELDAVCLLPVGAAAELPKAPQKADFNERAWFNGYGKQSKDNVTR
ncbi:hypothetical protein [uncultured Ruminococcus sp.]|uniref:hypothetical protein n=1 Tax=uncultured Ruminococcus sp. TaxID=165186 RepID=UPI0025FF9A68|nr:hypothetical protein [uncultured Ruminococcus sp.]